MNRNPLLVLAAAASAAVALLHLAVIVVGPAAYRYFGAGEAMARRAEAGSLLPAAGTLLVALVFGAFAAYGFAGAGLAPRLPLQRAALAGIAAIYLLRGLSAIPQAVALVLSPGSFPVRFFVFSDAALIVGLLYAAGTIRAWRGASAPAAGP